MAIASESMLYQERIAPSHVSSSGYYGYVPPTSPLTDYESSNVVKHPCNSSNEAINETTTIVKRATPSTTTNGNNHWTIPGSTLFSQYHNNHNNNDMIRNNDFAMEIDENENQRNDDDDDDESRVGVSRCQNKRCVIPETDDGIQCQNIIGTSSSSSSFSYGGRYESFYRLFDETDVNNVMKKRGNRKRNSAGDPAYLIDDRGAANFTKKLRKDGGNGNFFNGSGSTGKLRSSTLRYESTLLTDVKNLDISTNESFAKTKILRCHEKTRNYDDSLGNNNHVGSCNFKKISENTKFGDSYLEDYEIMLMETHGCTLYHYNRYRQLDTAVSAETEF